MPQGRAPTFILGIALGCILFKTREKRIELKTSFVIFGWICCFTLITVPVFINHVFLLEEKAYNRLQESLYLSCWRSVWSLGIAWIIWACVNGYGGNLAKKTIIIFYFKKIIVGPINYLLSFPSYQILGRLTYATFLVHMGTQTLMHGAAKSAGFFSDFNMVFS